MFGVQACNALVRCTGVVHTLVSLVTVEAQSYGAEACIGMKVRNDFFHKDIKKLLKHGEFTHAISFILCCLNQHKFKEACIGMKVCNTFFFIKTLRSC